MTISQNKNVKSLEKTSTMDTIVTDGDRIVKMEVDYSETCDTKIPEAEKMAEEGKVTEAIEALMSLEKQARTGGDAHSTSRVLIALVEICFKASKWELLNETVVLLTKKRSQIKMAVTKMIQKACEYVEKTPDKETKIKLIDTLRTVTAGKIYVEVERARLTHTLAKIKENDGDIEGAAHVMQEMSVETFGSMDRHEKVELILEQMRLCLLCKDYVRTQIISKKISTKFFDSGNHDDLKLKFYKLMIELDSHEGSYLSICRHYQAIYVTNEDVEMKKKVLKHVVLYLVLASFDNEQHDMLHRVKQDPLLPELRLYQDLLALFATQELIKWSGLISVFEEELRGPSTDVFEKKTTAGDERWEKLRERVVQHNIRMMAKYYTRINLKRMAELLDLPVTECETLLCQLVVNGTVVARIDRMEGIVRFGEVSQNAERLNEWSNSVHSLMKLVSKTTHLINKEQMVHRHLLGGVGPTSSKATEE